MPEYNITFDWNRISTLGKVKILVEQVVGAPSQEAIDAAVATYIEEHPGSISGLSEAAKVALLQIAEKVAYIDEDGQDYYDALYSAFYPPVDLIGITAVYTQSGTVYDTDSLDDLKSDLVVTALYSDSTSEVITSGYTLSGTLTVGTSTITVAYQGQTATFTVTVTAKPNLVMPTLTINGTTYLCGLGSDSVPCWGLYLRTSSQGRRTLAYDTGTVKYRARQTTGSNADFLNCPEVDYYPIPIPAGATTITVTCPSNISLIVGIGQIDSSDNYYHKIYEPTWDTASTSHTADVSSYNDGTYFAHINLNTQLTSVEGFNVTFA